MAIQDKETDLMERYLDGSLSDDEKRLLEAALDANSELKEKFDYNTKLKQIWVDANEYEETKSQIKAAISLEKEQKKSRTLWNIVSVAAAVIILLGSYYFISQNQQGNDLETPLRIAKDVQEPSNKLHIDQPTYYAKTDSISTVQLISPVKKAVIHTNSKIEFKWYSTLTIKDTLRIYSLFDNKAILQIPVYLSDSVIGLQSASLEEGSYYWKFDSQKDKGEFIIK